MKLLSLARDLRRRKARERQFQFVVEGVRCAEELLRSSLRIEGALVAPQLAEAPRGRALYDAMVARGIRYDDVSARELASAAETESPQGVLVIAHVPSRALSDLRTSATAAPILVLDAVQDPGNVGTMLRTAAALGACATIALPGTVDLWNAKVVRSAVGAHFGHFAFQADLEPMLDWFVHDRRVFWGAAADGVAHRTLPRPARVALAVGNEGRGFSAGVAAAVAQRVSIPLAPGAESLNVAVATGILLESFRS